MKNADQPAFAQSFANDKDGNMYSAHEKDSRNAGLSKREYFAVMMMQGILANPSNSNLDLMGVNTQGPLGFIAANFAAKEAVVYADELLKQLES